MSNFLKVITIMAVILVGIGLLGGVVLVATGNSTIILPNITKDGVSYNTFSFNQHGYHENVSRPEKPTGTDSRGLNILDGEITDISLELGAVEMYILKGDENAFDATEFNGKDLEVSLTNGKLKISTGEKTDFVGRNLNERTLVLYLNSTDFDTVTIRGGASTFYSDASITCKDLIFDVGVGKSEISNVTATKSSSIMVGLGEGIVNGTFLNKIDVECGMGSLEMAVTGDQSDYGYQIDGGMGSVRVGTDNAGGVGFERAENSDAENFFTINCGMGSVDIDFTK